MPELNWVGKNEIITHHTDVPFRVLARQYSFGESGQFCDDNGSPNMIIRGDNLEALKTLLPQYGNRIDCVYIDPPYNTGNEGWIYNDNVSDPRIKKWLGEVVGKEGEDLSRHDKWLSMMYPRLRLLHRLLAPTGVIFISIDDHEEANLRLICDEIFGRRNHLATFIWESSGNTDNQADIISVHEYILVYAKDKKRAKINAVVDPNVEEDSKIRRNFVENSAVKNGAKNPPSLVTLPTGFPCSVDTLDLEAHAFADQFIEEARDVGFIERQMSTKYDVTYPLRLDPLRVRDGRLVEPCRVFTGWSNANKLVEFLHNDCRPLPSGGVSLRFYVTHTGAVYYRREGRESHYVQSVLRNMGTTETNKYMLEAMNLSFDYPKPVDLIQYLISLYCPDDGVVLDSFAGSGTTGQAVLNLNKHNGTNRTFILVELGDYADSLTAERIRKTITGFTQKKTEETILFEQKLTIGALQKTPEILAQADEVIAEAKATGDYKKVSRPRLVTQVTGKTGSSFVRVTATQMYDEVVSGTGGSFSFYELDETLMLEGNLNPSVPVSKVREYIWFAETNTPLPQNRREGHPYFLGIDQQTAYHLIYEPDRTTNLNRAFLQTLIPEVVSNSLVIYADTCTLSDNELAVLNITFKKIPRDIPGL